MIGLRKVWFPSGHKKTTLIGLGNSVVSQAAAQHGNVVQVFVRPEVLFFLSALCTSWPRLCRVISLLQTKKITSRFLKKYENFYTVFSFNFFFLTFCLLTSDLYHYVRVAAYQDRESFVNDQFGKSLIFCSKITFGGLFSKIIFERYIAFLILRNSQII